jgi:hypothetical protein
MEHRTTADPSILYTDRHADRLFLATLREEQPPFTVEFLAGVVQQETAYWTTLATTAPTGTAFLHAFEQVQTAMEALKKESRACTDLEQALLAHEAGAWVDAHVWYQRVISELQSALKGWGFALGMFTHDTPFDQCWTAAERTHHEIELPSRTSSREMLLATPMLLRAYRSMDRLSCLLLELAQRLAHCLSQYLAEAEQREAMTTEHQAPPEEHSPREPKGASPHD